jgi:homoserine kinase
MGAFADGAVTVSVPATSANLGPGFDCLGLALGLRDEITGEVVDGGLVVEVSGEGAGEVPDDESHLVVRAMRAGFEALEVAPPGLRLRCRNGIPHSRGLGSSAAAIVGGLVLARALVPDAADRLDDAALLTLANRLEGHPDNVAPALLGGFVVSGQEADDHGHVRVWAQQAPVHDAVRAALLVPPTGVLTQVARGLLPEQVSHHDAVANTGRAALLVAALGQAPHLVLAATEDFVHQRYRRPAMPETLDLVDRLRADGVPAVVSGAGPTVLVLISEDVAELDERAPDGWTVLRLAVDHAGARVH